MKWIGYVDDTCAQYSNATYYEMDWTCGWCVRHDKYFWGVKESVVECFCPLKYLFDK